MSFNPSKWNNFLNEELLIEGRLQDTMKKFPEIDPEIIKQLSLSDPSGKNAYLMWMTQAMKDSGAGIYSVPGLARERIFDIVPIVADFDKAKQRISQLNKNRKEAGKSLYPNDINQFKSLEQLETFIDELGLSSSEEKKREKEAALGGATIMQDDEDFFVIRPLTKESSCFFGRKTKWCISAVDSQNYYDSYTRQGKSFYFVLNKNLPENSNFKKVALVFDKSGEFDEWFDTPDKGYSSEYELGNVLLFNILAPAIKGMGMAVNDSDIDEIADVFRNGSQLEKYLGEDVDEDDRGPEQRINRKVYKGIVDYLKKNGNDLPVDVSEIPELGSTTLYDSDGAAAIFSSIADQTWGQMYADAQTDTEENRPGSFDSEDLRGILQNAGLQHIDVYYDEEWDGEWTWHASFGFDMEESPFNLLQYKNPAFDPDEEESDDNFKYGDYDDVYGSYSDEGEIEEIIANVLNSNIYFDDIDNSGTGEFSIQINPDDSEMPREGLEGFEEFVRRIKEYDKRMPDMEEEIYESLQDHDLAIHSDQAGLDKENWVETLKNLKHLGYEVKSGKMDVFGKTVFEIPNMMRNMRELRKIFPALPEGEVVTIFGKSGEEKEIFRRQEGLVNQLEYYINREIRRGHTFTRRMLNNISDKLNRSLPPGKKYSDTQAQISLPGTGVRGPADKKPGENYIPKWPEMGFMNQLARFDPRIKLMTGIEKGEKENSELSIGDREITGAHGVGSFGFFGIPVKFLRDMQRKNPEEFQMYINGFKWLDENWQDFQDMIGEYVSSQIVPIAKSLKGIPELADLEREDFGQRARDSRPRSGLAEMCGSKPKMKIRIKLK